MGSLSKSRWHKTMGPGWISLCGRKSPLSREPVGRLQAILTIQTSILAHCIHDGHEAPEGLVRPILVGAPSSAAEKHHRDTQEPAYIPDLPQQGPDRPRPGARLGWKASLSWDFLCDESGRKIKDVVLASLRVELSEVFCSWLSA